MPRSCSWPRPAPIAATPSAAEVLGGDPSLYKQCNAWLVCGTLYASEAGTEGFKKPDINKAVAAHPYSGRVDSVNTMWADGHVETHPRATLKHVYSGNAHSFY